ncbi:MAG: cell division protein FtsZ [Bacteroidales bacterium]|jgi:cell division protein FtsZ|nr:cell division protein FtsZ [Bacteroidales bacterium]
MSEDLMNFDLPVDRSSIIKVVGIGGGGGNAVNHMFRKGIKDVNFIVCNTDLQALMKSPVPVRVQIGESTTEGLGAGSQPERGRASAIENIEDVMNALSGNTKMVFITAGMGGGTGTGATPVIAKACRDAGYLTVAVVTIPFRSELNQRIKLAISGINELKDKVDSLIVINNERLRQIYGDEGVSAAFARADDVLANAVKGIAEIITCTGYINVDFADVDTVMRDSGVALMGIGTASGEDRATRAIEAALTSPLLSSNDITGARSILLNIKSGTGVNEITMDELGELTDYVYETVSDDALIIRGLSTEESLGDSISVTVVATGFEASTDLDGFKPNSRKEVVSLNSAQQSALTEGAAENTGQYVVRSSRTTDRGISAPGTAINQGVIDFEPDGDISITPAPARPAPPSHDKNEGTLRKLKHMQNVIKNEGLSTQSMSDNIEDFEEVPAYVRKKIAIHNASKAAGSKVSKFTLTLDEDNQPVIRENNAYLNDNVD